jgi:hypothetical protein
MYSNGDEQTCDDLLIRRNFSWLNIDFCEPLKGKFARISSRRVKSIAGLHVSTQNFVFNAIEPLAKSMFLGMCPPGSIEPSSITIKLLCSAITRFNSQNTTDASLIN